MDVILHLGAHRTATTSFQSWMREQAPRLSEHQIGYWGPGRTRGGVLAGVLPETGFLTPAEQLERAKGRIARNLARCTAKGIRSLVISDENILGAPRRALKDRELYRAAGFRLARYEEAFQGRISHVHLTIRSLDRWWASVAAFAVSRGEPVPPRAAFATLAQSRGWRDVITDIACALPGAAINVSVFEEVASRPAAKLFAMTGHKSPPSRSPDLNASPDLRQLREILTLRGEDPAVLGEGQGRWNPFTAAEAFGLKETYGDDLFWLASGADGLATLTGNRNGADGANPQPTHTTRGRKHDERKGCVA
jgi:hypothetical protein